MSNLAFIGRRVVRLLITVWTVFTLAFLYITLTPFTRNAIDYSQVSVSADDPLAVRYIDWLAWFLTIWDEPVMSMLLDYLSFTAVYLVPSLLFAVAVGVALRVYSLGREGTSFDAKVSALTVVAVSVPVFLVALFLRTTLLNTFFRMLGTVRIYDRSVGPLARRNLIAAVWPTVSMALYLLAVQSRYAGDVLEEYAGADFVKTARAKGASDWRVGRHVFRNTAIPLVTLFFTDMLGTMVVGIFAVEHVVGVPGLGDLLITVIFEQDVRLILSLSVTIVVVGILVNFIQDIAYLLFDPRVDFDE